MWVYLTILLRIITKIVTVERSEEQQFKHALEYCNTE